MNLEGSCFQTRHLYGISLEIFLLLCIITSALSQIVFNPGTDGCNELEFKCSSGEYSGCIALSRVCDGENYYQDIRYYPKGGCNLGSNLNGYGGYSSDEVVCQQESFGKTNNTSAIDFELYASTMRAPLNEEIEEHLSLYDYKETVRKFRDFNPEEVMRQLTEQAASRDIKPITFTEEMRIILSSHSEDAGGYSSGRLPYVDFLMKKYNISWESQDPNAATLFRLHLMFPHYTKIGFRSTFNQDKIDIPGLLKVPAVFNYAEFGGLIPRKDSSLIRSGVREVLIGLYLAIMNERPTGETLPYHVRCIKLRERMGKSLLSDELRVQLLQNYNILTKEGNLVGHSFDCLQNLSRDISDCTPMKFFEDCRSFLTFE